MTKVVLRKGIALALSVCGPCLLAAKTVRVPGEYATIRSAVLAARPGDTIEVEDGVYFEDDIVVDKNLRIRARRPFGAVVYGRGRSEEALIIIRAAVALEGLILKNATRGILLRGSPEASLTGRDLAFLNMTSEAVSINDVSANYGKAYLSNIIVDGAGIAFSTNDAHTLEVRYALVSNCKTAFSGYDHIRFFADKVILWNCAGIKSEAPDQPPDKAVNTISLGPRILVFDPAALDREGAGVSLSRLFNMVGDFQRNMSGRAQVARGMEGFSFLSTAEIYLHLKDHRKARDFFRNALSIGTASGLKEIVWRANYGLARALEMQGRRAEALAAFKTAVDSVETAAGDLPIRPTQGPFFRDKISLYESTIRLLMALQAADPSRGYDREAFLLSERSKAWGFLDLLSKFDPAAVWRDLGPGLTAKVLTAGADLSRVQTRLRDPALDDAGRRAVLDELDLVETRFGNLMREIGLKKLLLLHHRMSALDFDALRSGVLDDETALCEYFVGDGGSYLFTLTTAGLAVDPLPPRDELKRLVGNYLKFLTLGKAHSFDAVPGGSMIHDLLVGPARARFGRGIRRLLIVPDDCLCALPFESLVCCGGRALDLPLDGRAETRPRARFLVEDLEIAYAPSVRSLAELFNRPRPGPRPKDLLVVANPKPFLNRGLSSNAPLGLPDLDFIKKEIKAVQGFFPADRSVRLVGDDATESALIRLPLAGFRIIHFAAHGVFDDQNWWRSAILLHGKDPAGADGLLQMLDVYLLRLSADLVVLSACQTAQGQLERAEGVTGLVSAFFHAGARSVVSSLWSINDESTSLFMKSFYGSLTGGSRTAEALRKAKLAMLETKFAHPFYWASFVLSGDFRAGLEPGPKSLDPRAR